MPAAMPAATVIAAAVLVPPMLMIVMIAMHVRIIAQRSGQERFYCLVRIPLDASIQPNSRFSKRGLRSAADSSANERIDLIGRKKSRQSAVARAVGCDDLFTRHFSVRDVIEFKLFRMSEVLKNLPVFIGDCNPHGSYSFLRHDLHVGRAAQIRTSFLAERHRRSPAKPIMSSGNDQTLSVNQAIRNLAARGFIDLRDGSARNIHQGRALFVRASFQIDQANRLVLIQR